jgi:hypothetical protein
LDRGAASLAGTENTFTAWSGASRDMPARPNKGRAREVGNEDLRRGRKAAHRAHSRRQRVLAVLVARRALVRGARLAGGSGRPQRPWDELTRHRGRELGDLVGDMRETVDELPAPGGSADLLLGHSLGALTTAWHVAGCRFAGSSWRTPGPQSTDFGAVAEGVEADAPLARAKSLRRQLAEHPAWAEEDAENDVASLAECDAGPSAELVGDGLRHDLVSLLHAIRVLVLLVLAGVGRGSPLVGQERAAAGAARRVGRGVRDRTRRPPRPSDATWHSWENGLCGPRPTV